MNGKISQAITNLEILDTKVSNKNSKKCNLQVYKDISVAKHSMNHQSENAPIFKAVESTSSSASNKEL